MQVDDENEALLRIASGEAAHEGSWPRLRAHLVERLDEIAHNDFPIPKLPPPRPPPTIESRMLSSLPASSSSSSSSSVSSLPAEKDPSQEEDKDEGPTTSDMSAGEQPRDAAPDELPPQISDMLVGIKKNLGALTSEPPHTVQRLAELVLRPRAHYRALASYLHAVDRVTCVTSGTSKFPLPPGAVPETSGAGHVNGEEGDEDEDEARDPAAAVAWSNPTAATLGTDEALGGALLTPIPWLTRGSSDGEDEDEDEEEHNGEGATPTGRTPTPTPATGRGGGAQIHSEGSETIDGPNGVGRVETVSVSVNGVPSTGHHTRGLRARGQDQRGGVGVGGVSAGRAPRGQESCPEKDGQDGHVDPVGDDDDDAEVPRARGPQEIGIEDTGPQGSATTTTTTTTTTTSYVGQDGSLVPVAGIDVDAAPGHRGEPHDGEKTPPAAAPAEDGDASSVSGTEESAGTKREAGQALEGGHQAKKMRGGAGSAPVTGQEDGGSSSAAGAALPGGGEEQNGGGEG